MNHVPLLSPFRLARLLLLAGALAASACAALMAIVLPASRRA
ncbi:hypothetical protein [Massilia pseudoviolaceinigra]|nr:hypothetical protein [Massilia sp. CCM 9206]MDQ1919039.1 hypothetical protein [Massilia sp. CCM 9206]